MSNLADPQFGREQLIGKLVAIVPESDFGHRDDRGVATSFLKAVTGEDNVSIGRKFKREWQGTLPTRFFFVANKTPRWSDDSPALSIRSEPLQFATSFVGKEDERLTEKLIGELPGIFNWALFGYRQLRSTQRFTQPESSTRLREDIRRLASGVLGFIESDCVIESADLTEGRGVTSEDDLYRAYKVWADRCGGKAMPKGEFVESIATAMPTRVQKYRPRVDGQRGPRSFIGITLPPDRLAGIM